MYVGMYSRMYVCLYVYMCDSDNKHTHTKEYLDHVSNKQIVEGSDS